MGIKDNEFWADTIAEAAKQSADFGLSDWSISIRAANIDEHQDNADAAPGRIRFNVNRDSRHATVIIFGDDAEYDRFSPEDWARAVLEGLAPLALREAR